MSKELTPEQEQVIADKFLRQCMLHISNASESQKKILLRTLLARPPESLATIEQAFAIWNGLTEAEVMKLLGHVCKQFDKDTWDFIARWRQ